MNGKNNWLLVVLLLVALAMAALWHFRTSPENQAPAKAQPEAPAAATEVPRSPQYPVPSPPAGTLVDLPPLDDSDAYFKLALIDLFGTGVDGVIADAGLIDRFVATVDSLPRTRIAESIRPVKRLADPFRAIATGDSDQYLPDLNNYVRYDGLTMLLTGVDMRQLVDTYRRFYPLFQEAYVRLGYPGGHFNDRVIAVIDDLLATPEPDGPIRLVRPKVLYLYADPDLESLSSGQKLLLRTGAGNSADIKRFLQDLRAELVSLD